MATYLKRLIAVVGIVVELVQVTLYAETREPSAGPGVVRDLQDVVVLVDRQPLLVMVVLGPLGQRRRDRRRRRRPTQGRRRTRDKTHAVRVGRLLVVVHQYPLVGGIGCGPGTGHGNRRATTCAEAGRRHRGLAAAVVIGRHVNGQHRMATETRPRIK